VFARDVTAARIAHVTERLRRIPDQHREFVLDEDAVWRGYRVPADVLGLLCEHGLPNRCGRVDPVDVHNVTLHLGVSAAAVAARRFWAAGLRRTTKGTDRYEVSYQVSCPAPGHDGECRYHFVLPELGQVERVSRTAHRATESVEVVIRSDWPDLSQAARSWLDITRGIEFMRLPDTLCRDVAFIRETGLGDCVGVSVLLADEGVRRGLPVRRVNGLLLVVPYATPHNWVEVHEDGRWLPVDPVLIDAMIGWGVLDTPRWHRYRSPGAIFCGVTRTRQPLATHNQVPLRVTFPVRRMPQGETVSRTSARGGRGPRATRLPGTPQSVETPDDP
jgi:hypothetical protein